jgi:hypothetical protein
MIYENYMLVGCEMRLNKILHKDTQLLLLLLLVLLLLLLDDTNLNVFRCSYHWPKVSGVFVVSFSNRTIIF